MQSRMCFHPSKYLLRSLYRCWIISIISDNYDDWAAMGARINTLSDVMKKYRPGGHPDMQDRIDGAIQAINQQAKLIQDKQQRGFGRVLDENSDAHEIVDSLRAISFLIKIFQIGTALSTEVSVKSLVNDIELEKLRPVLDSRYDIAGSRGCMNGTRASTLAQLLAWATDARGPSVYWLNGMAGAGKSAIARSFAKVLEHDKLLGASFFCSRASEARSQVNMIVPTIAYQLACHSVAYSRAIVDVLKQNRDRSLPSSPLKQQFNKLIVSVSALCSSGEKHKPLVVVIDALDECSDGQATRDFLKTLLQSNHTGLKFLLTSRPEDHIRQELSHQTSLRLHDIERDIVTADVTRYLRGELYAISRRIRALNWPSDDDIAMLAEQAGGLFIFAFTVVQYLSKAGIPLKALQQRLGNILLSPPSDGSSNHRTKAIDDLYTPIFLAAYKEKEEPEIIMMRTALNTVICLRETLSLTGISALIGFTPEETRTVLSPFYSVIDIPDSDDTPVLLFHASFPDYVSDPHRSKNYALDASRHHLFLALACIEHMNDELRRNMCAKDRTAPISSFDDANIRAAIPPGLKYACLHWASHLSLGSNAPDRTEIIPVLQTFVDTHLLHWLECLSMLQKLDVAVGILQLALSSTVLQNSADVITLMNEARRMVPQVFKFVREYPLEVYASAQWLPLSSKLRALYLEKSAACIQSGLDQAWRGCEQTLQHEYEVQSVAFSPDGSRIASGSSDHTVKVWNVATGEEQQTFSGHSGRVQPVAFSPDGSRIASGSWDKTVKVWNVATGEEQQIFSGHSGRVQSVTFSPDGSRIASGSWDKTVKVWNVATGEEQQTFSGHLYGVNSVAFSPDGFRIASGSWDMTIKLWNVATGEQQQTFSGHLSGVHSVAFSPDGSRIASGSWDETVKVWNVATGEEQQTFSGHLDVVHSVAFSPDGSRIASGSWDETVRVWNVATGEEQQTFSGHSGRVQSVAFSPDGSRIASGSWDKTVKVWNVATGKEQQTFSGHLDGVHSVAFSPDGSRIASGSWDETVRVWNVATGEEQQTFSGHSGRVQSVAFSPDGSRIASGSWDKTIKVWNVATAKEQQTFSGHSGGIRSVAFSPDGSRIASGSWDETVKVWNVVTGEELQTFSNGSQLDLVPLGTTDGCLVAVTGPGEFAIVDAQFDLAYMEEHENGLRLQCVGANRPRNHLWMWKDYQLDISAKAFHGTKACLGYESGRIVVVDLAMDLEH
ncbi:WD40-repeat-containing domain protein [Mycena haematopus]|nr:WD40-repeat-containing domain protein [Mycena haematopus]